MNTAKVAIIGTGNVGRQIAQTLSPENHDVNMNDKVIIFTKTTEIKNRATFWWSEEEINLYEI